MARSTNSDGSRGESLTEDRLQDLLAPEPRRVAVEHLLNEGSASKPELITVVGEDVAEAPMDDHERVRIAVSLQVDHLPPLSEAGLIRVEGDTVSLSFLPDQVYDEMEAVLDSSVT